MPSNNSHMQDFYLSIIIFSALNWVKILNGIGEMAKVNCLADEIIKKGAFSLEVIPLRGLYAVNFEYLLKQYFLLHPEFNLKR